jgi:hypothetical protein
MGGYTLDAIDYAKKHVSLVHELFIFIFTFYKCTDMNHMKLTYRNSTRYRNRQVF